MERMDRNRPGFQPLDCGSICTQQGFALGWYGDAPLALEGCCGQKVAGFFQWRLEPSHGGMGDCETDSADLE
jgi:hypothetical protein